MKKTLLCEAGGFSVYKVDAEEVRDEKAVTFSGGANCASDHYVPRGEIWLQDATQGVLFHEALENRIMADLDMEYVPAHNLTNIAEAFYRKGIDLDEILEIMKEVLEIKETSVESIKAIMKAFKTEKKANVEPVWRGAVPEQGTPQQPQADPYEDYVSTFMGSPERRASIFDLAAGVHRPGVEGYMTRFTQGMGEAQALRSLGISHSAPDFEDRMHGAMETYFSRPGSIEGVFGTRMAPMEALATLGPTGLMGASRHATDPLLWSKAFGNAARTPQERMGAQRYLHAALSLNQYRHLMHGFSPGGFKATMQGIPGAQQQQWASPLRSEQTPLGLMQVPEQTAPPVLNPEFYPDNQGTADTMAKSARDKQGIRLEKLAFDMPKEWPTATDPKDASPHIYHTIRKDGEVVGMIKVSPKGSAYWIHNFWVKPSMRSEGLGKRLMKRITGIYGHHPLELEAEPFDSSPLKTEELKKFYERHGFVGTTGMHMRRPPDLSPRGEKTARDGIREDFKAKLKKLKDRQKCAVLGGGGSTPKSFYEPKSRLEKLLERREIPGEKTAGATMNTLSHNAANMGNALRHLIGKATAKVAPRVGIRLGFRKKTPASMGTLGLRELAGHLRGGTLHDAVDKVPLENQGALENLVYALRNPYEHHSRRGLHGLSEVPPMKAFLGSATNDYSKNPPFATSRELLNAMKGRKVTPAGVVPEALKRTKHAVAVNPKGLSDKLELIMRHLFGGKNCLNGAMKLRHRLDRAGVKNRMIFDAKKVHFGVQPIDANYGMAHYTGSPGEKMKFDYDSPRWLSTLDRLGSTKHIPLSNKFSNEVSSGSDISPERAKLPYRHRVEVFGVRGGKIYGGFFDDGKWGCPGGGLDGDDLQEAAKREFLEETGYTIGALKKLPVEDVFQDWLPPYKSAKQAERAKTHRGSQTTYMWGAVLPGKPVAKAGGADGKSGLHREGFHHFEDAIAACGTEEKAAGNLPQREARKKALQYLLAHQFILSWINRGPRGKVA
jgi:ADP-ribose pyrophosphatase YjhB (NUDIX family)/GNAT superfamily N-acetyltransferase